MGFGEIVAILVPICLLHSTDCAQLDDYISHYQELHYNTDHVHNAHLRHKRSVDNHVNIDLQAFNKPLKLKLKADSSPFTEDFVLEFGNRLQKPDLSFLYSGEVVGEPGSHVHGAIIEGVFRGSIHVPSQDETYHVEKSHRFFDNKPVFHSVIYKESAMNFDPYRERRTRERREAKETGTCGYDNALKYMKQVVESEVVPQNRAKRHEKQWQEIHSGADNKYSAQANSNSRLRRNVNESDLRMINGGNNSCFMSLMSDIFFWRRYMEKANSNVELAKDEILAFFASHINAIKKIYRETLFQTYDGSLKFSEVTFAVQRTKIMMEEDCNNADYSDFCEANIDVSNFLNLNSLINHNLYCLAYVFTYRDFSQGTLGLAWVGSASTASGGLCERNKRFTEGSSQVSKSLNTGIVTTINYGKEVPSKVSQLTFAHEVGHNFGSPHDTGPLCAPYGTSAVGSSDGNFIMFASATMGDKPNNSKFSMCSKDNITRVIDAVLRSGAKTNCFKQSGPFCGNGIVEGIEECDCGVAADCKDTCCVPMSESDPNSGCKLTPGSHCSPSQGPCCADSCNFIDTAELCRYKSDCAAEAYCNGNNATCPASVNVADGSYCSNHGFTCQGGECSGSLCKAIGGVGNSTDWDECFLTGDTKTKEDQEKLCKLSCQDPADNRTDGCIASDYENLQTEYPAYYAMLTEVVSGRASDTGNQGAIDKGVQLAPGSPCNYFQGYCDVFYRCRGVDAEGPLARLKNLIFNPETLEDIQNWIVEKWWAVLLMAIGLVLAMGIFIKFCAVHTPSSNPKAKPARKLSETMTLRRKRNQNRQGASSQPQQQRGYPQNPQGPPPPYPGSSTSASGSQLGPPHGHGKKGKHRKGQIV